ncbi:MAG: HAD hydrolase-like protein, partial [Alphaproteobacteria bacterium]|nr:HAD hydrolase-like protein [Alphaproteobacteria bacterium]
HRIMAVGDSFRTDIAGAEAAGIASLFIAGGIHGRELATAEGRLDPAALNRLAAEAGHRPTAAATALRWADQPDRPLP